MERDKSFGAGGDSSSRIASSYDKSDERTRFTVELRPGETTIVSWKKLMKDVPKPDDLFPSLSHPAATSAPEPSTAGFHPALESRLAPGQPDSNELKDPTGPNRFNSVIEKIERLYMGKDSSDEDLGDIPDDDQYDTEDSFIDDAELDEYFEVDKSKTKHDGFFVNRGKLESIESSMPSNEQPKKRRRKEMVKSTETNAQKLSADDSGYIRYQGKSGSGHSKNLSGKANSSGKSELSFQHREKNGNRELIDLNVAAVKHPVKASIVHKKEGSSKPKSAILDKAIRELEKAVVESRPPAADLQDADASSQAVKRRLSREIKQKLAKVARLGVSHGKVSKELLSRLMNILGHLINVRSLKRNLKIMINSSLPANQEKDDKFQQIKRDVIEIIKTHCDPAISKAADQHPGGAENDQESHLEEKGSIKVKFNMDPVLEDKICYLYDIFVDGIDDDVAPQARKLYAELAELWPKGVMDNHGIKRAICHSKERRRTLHDKNKEHGSIKKKKMVAVKMEETRVESTSAMQPHYIQGRAISDFGGHGTNPHNKSTSGVSTNTATANSASTTLGLPAPLLNAQNIERPKHEKIKGSANSSYVEIRAPDGTLVKKKVKRKPEINPGEIHSRSEKLSLHSGDRQKSHKQKLQNSSNILPSFKQMTGYLES